MLVLAASCGAHLSRGSLLGGVSMSAARCRYGAVQTSLLVTEWSASEKADLEALVNEGRGVAVAFSGCQMRVLTQCKLKGTYTWQRTTPSSDYVDIKNDVDLYTKLPLGAVSLSGELKRSGSLVVQTTVAGQKRLEGLTAAEVPMEGECAQATHVVNALSLGAFVLSAGGDESAEGSADVKGIGSAGGKGSRSAHVVRSAGDAQSCAAAADGTAPTGCSSPIQVFLAPIPGRAEAVGPPGTMKVDFESSSASTRWDVYVDDQATCTTPCSRWVDPTRPVVMRTRDLPDKLRVANLDPALGPVQITAEPKSFSEWATGVVFTAFGGLGVATGITLTSIGCGSSEFGGSTMCASGLITLGVSSVVTAGAIWMIFDSRPRAHVHPIFGTEMGGMVVWGPGVAGTF